MTQADGRAKRAGTTIEREILVLAAVVVSGTIMTALDLTIVNVAIPTLGHEFDASIATIQWVMTGYMIGFAGVIPLTGWSIERFGARRVWIVSLLLFVSGSVLAGTAGSLGWLIGFRVLQGLGGGMILPVGQTILARAAGPHRMGRIMTLMGVPMLLAPVLGPVIGGAIVDDVSWRWIFYINLPVGILALIAAQRLLPETSPRRARRLDVRGLALLSPGIALLLYGLAAVGKGAGLANAGTLPAMSAGTVLTILFVRHARLRGGAALLDVSLFARRGFAAAAAANFLLPAALFGSLLLLPLYYQLVRHEGALVVGLMLVPQGAGAALAMPLAGLLTDRVGARPVVSAGIGVAMLGTIACANVGSATPYPYLVVALAVLGIGIGSTIMPSMAAAFQTLTPEETPRATSALNVVQRVGGAIGTALLAVVLQRAITANVPGLADGIQAIAALPRERWTSVGPALADAFGAAFWVATGLTAAALVPAILLPPPPGDTRLTLDGGSSVARPGRGPSDPASP